MTHRPDSALLPYRSWSTGPLRRSDCAADVVANDESEVRSGEEFVESTSKNKRSSCEKKSIVADAGLGDGSYKVGDGILNSHGPLPYVPVTVPRATIVLHF